MVGKTCSLPTYCPGGNKFDIQHSMSYKKGKSIASNQDLKPATLRPETRDPTTLRPETRDPGTLRPGTLRPENLGPWALGLATLGHGILTPRTLVMGL